METPVIVSACRTPIGKFQGALAALPAPELGAIAIREAVRRAGVPAERVDEVIMGVVVAAGLGQNPARQAALKAGLPPAIPALTINKVCGSGLKAVMLAAQSIKAGDQACVVAGGMESMSRTPYLMHDARNGFRMGHGTVHDSMVQDGLWCALDDHHMGITAELVAEKYEISRRAQDEFALKSHQKALAAWAAGHFAAEVVPVELKDRKGNVTRFEKDESPRADTSLEALGKLKPAFKKEGGTVTAGNAPGTNDAAAAVVVMGQSLAKELGAKPLGRIVAYAAAGLEPKWVMMAPVEASRKALAKAGWKTSDLDLVEANEAFAVQAAAVTRELGLDPEKVNVSGGAVALGHPIGASGTRVLVTLLHGMARTGAKRGLVTLCLGGGNAVAMVVER